MKNKVDDEVDIAGSALDNSFESSCLERAAAEEEEEEDEDNEASLEESAVHVEAPLLSQVA